MSKLIFLNIGWMEKYNGLDGDKITGGGGFVQQHGYGHEIFNFRPFQATLYGYAPADKSVNLARLGGLLGQESVGDVLVVWVATKPEKGGRHIVGWYANATVFRKVRDAPPGCSNRLIPPDLAPPEEKGKQAAYIAIAAKDDGVLLGVAGRTFRLPPKGPGVMGQSPVWFAEGPTNAHFRQELLEYIKERTQVHNLAKRKYGPGGEGAEHNNLKEWCAWNPHELGLEDVAQVPGTTEFSFISGDRADIVFEMTGGRWAVVEVETDSAEPGAHQALKYRVLMCAQNGLPITSEKVEGWLVAHQVPPTVREFCKSYNLRWKEVPPEVVGPST